MTPAPRRSPPGSHLAWLRATIASPPEGCAPFPGPLFKHGYGMVWFEGRVHCAHRVAFLLAHGSIPDGMHILHTCLKNRPCCNPLHLYAGTNTQNVADRLRDGTSAHLFGDTNGSRLHPECLNAAAGDEHWSRRRPEKVLRGEAVGGSKLDAGRVREIRRRGDLGEVHRLLASEFGVSPGLVQLIIARKRWGHVV